MQEIDNTESRNLKYGWKWYILIPTEGKDCNAETISVENSQNIMQDTIPENGQNCSFIESSLNVSSKRDQSIKNVNDQSDIQMCKADDRQLNLKFKN